PRSIYSIWDKMQKQQKTIDEIFQLQSVRVVFKPNESLSEKMQCLKIYSIITDIYRPKPGQIKDWVSSPKSNGYEAIHVVVMGSRGGFVEFQIRSERMDNIAEKGFAVQSRYQKDASDSELDKWLRNLKEILDNPEADTMAFLDEFKLNLYTKEIQVFTPKGETITLPKYATVLDFAYNIHTEVGNQCIGAKINHKLVPANHVLNSGDQIEILTSEKQQPKTDWITFVVTAKAKSNIKTALKQKRKELITRGSKLIENRLLDESMQLNAKAIKKMLEHYKLSGKEELFCKIGDNQIDVEDLVPIVKKKSQNKFVKYWRLNFFSSGNKKQEPQKETPNKPDIDTKKKLILTESQQNENYTIASCCNPI
ncbi:MAG: GTP pyrophosphokinase, partial [Bacteroidia bacterium]